MVWGSQRRTPARRKQIDRARNRRLARTRRICRHAAERERQKSVHLQNRAGRRPAQPCTQPAPAPAHLALRVLSV
eukprot:5747519-Pleurochrysis_carterae.AAC.1